MKKRTCLQQQENLGPLFRWRLPAGLLAIVCVFGCHDPTSSRMGAAQVGVSVQALSAAAVMGVRVTVSGDGVEPAIVSPLTLTNDVWSGLIESIPAGEMRTFTVEAMDADEVVIYSGSTEGVSILEGETVNVQIFLQQSVPPDAFENSVPRFTAIVLSDTSVAPGATVSLRAEATDPDSDDTLSFAWLSDAGSFDDAASSDVNWTAPDTKGEYRLTVRVTDSKGASAALSTVIAVDGASAQDGSAAVSLSLNSWPEVTSLVASLTQLDVNETTTLSLVADDPDGDALSFDWQSDCDGVFSDATLQNPAFTLNSLPDDSADCQLTVEISDGQGGENHAALSLATGPRLGTGGPTTPDNALFATGFESGQPAFVNLKSSGEVSNVPPAGIVPRNGNGVITLSSITTTYGGRELRSEACISLDNETDAVTVSAFGTAGAENGGNEISSRLTLLWFDDDACAVVNVEADTSGTSAVLPEGSYEMLALDAVPPSGATHVRVRIDVRDNNGGDNLGDDFAVDDVLMVR